MEDEDENEVGDESFDARGGEEEEEEDGDADDADVLSYKN